MRRRLLSMAIAVVILTESFKMGFTPHGDKSTYWSNEVAVGIE